MIGQTKCIVIMFIVLIICECTALDKFVCTVYNNVCVVLLFCIVIIIIIVRSRNFGQLNVRDRYCAVLLLHCYVSDYVTETTAYR